MLQEVASVLGAGRRRGAGTSEGAKFWATAKWRWKAPVHTKETMRRGLCAYTLLMEGEGRRKPLPSGKETCRRLIGSHPSGSGGWDL